MSAARRGSGVVAHAACGSCPLTFTGQTWLALPLADTLTPSAISEHVVGWPATQSIEVRRCRCGRCIARKVLGEGVRSTARSLAVRAEARTRYGEDSDVVSSIPGHDQGQDGKTPEDFKALAAKEGLLGSDVKAGEVVSWLKEDFGLGHGHAMAIVAVFRRSSSPRCSTAEKLGEHFRGNREQWRTAYDGLVGKLEHLGPGVSVAPTSGYLSVLKGKKKFAIIQVTADRIDIGIKLAGVKPTSRLEIAGTWNSMVTHRVRVTNASQIDAPLLSWLRQAYDRV